MIAIVVSRADRASEHIGEHLFDLADWTEHADETRPDADGGGTYYRTGGRDGSAAFELRTFDELHIELDGVAEAFHDPDLLVFASRHAGETGALLTSHFTGNFGAAEYGGESQALARACPNAQAVLFDAFVEHAPEAYDVGIECTHHGPTDVGVPSMFVELGSGDEQWDDPDGARAVARAILDLDEVAPDRDRQIVGFGGGHYAPRFTRILEETPWGVGHIGADWQLEELGAPDANRDVIDRAFDASGAEIAVIDGEHPELESVVRELGYRVVTETWLREVGDAPLELVDALESSVASVDEGLRFGERIEAVDPAGVADPADAFTVVDLPDDLLEETLGIDAEATRQAVAAHAIAFETEENGTRPMGRAAVRAREDREALIEALAGILERKYDEVEHADEAVVARTVTFDPSKAATLGVPEGPKFGRLASGQPVEVDGEEIPPSAVESERVERFPI